MERSEKLQELLQQLKTFDSLLSQTEGDEISEDLTLRINSTLEELNHEIVNVWRCCVADQIYYHTMWRKPKLTLKKNASCVFC